MKNLVNLIFILSTLFLVPSDSGPVGETSKVHREVTQYGSFYYVEETKTPRGTVVVMHCEEEYRSLAEDFITTRMVNGQGMSVMLVKKEYVHDVIDMLKSPNKTIYQEQHTEYHEIVVMSFQPTK